MRTSLIASLTALLGGVLGAVLGDVVTRALRVSDFEGARGYAVVFVIIPAAVIAGAVIGVVVVRRLGREASWWKATGLAVAVTAAVGGAVAGLVLLGAPRAPRLDGDELDLVLEVRFPEGRAAPDTTPYGGFSAVLVSNGNSRGRVGVGLDLAHPSVSAGRVVIGGRVWLAETTRNRSLALNDGDDGYWFDLPLAAKPTAADREWSEWFPAPGQRASTDVRGTAGFQVRWKVAATE